MTNNAAFIRSIRGPVLLIAGGILFAIDHSGGMPFERTWPALVILIGVMKLLERAIPMQTEPPVYPGAPPAWNPQYSGAYQPPPQPPPVTPEEPNDGGTRP